MHSPEVLTAGHTLDIEGIRAQFPILAQTVHGRPLVYLDSAASSQKPNCVIEAVADFYRGEYANIHRGVHWLSQRATSRFEHAREVVANHLNTAVSSEVIFVRGATEGINLVAQSFARPRLRAGDEVVVTAMEHHANIVPWQLVCEMTGANLRVAPMNDRGELDVEAFAALMGAKTRMVALSHVSNALGTINPVQELIRLAHEVDAAVLLDSAQALPHMAVDVQDLDCDFLVFSGHKVYGPSGIGVLYGRYELLSEMPPYQGGGDMIREVTFERTTFADPPNRFEAGTPNIEGAVGLGVALEFLAHVGLERIASHEHALLEYGTQRLAEIPGLRLVGTAQNKASVLSFVIDDVHPHDIGTIVDMDGVAIRTGHHCAQPVMTRMGIAATARASLGMYNTRGDIDTLVGALHKVLEVFA